jgi:anti-anti-sigma factor
MFTLQTDPAQTPCRVTAGGELTIYHAAELHRALTAQVAQSATLVVDLSQVAEIDTAGMQTLLVAQRGAAAAGGGLAVVEWSDAALECARLLNLADVLSASAD